VARDFPRVEEMSDLIGDRDYADRVRWRVFEDLDSDGSHRRNVLFVLGDRWTILDGVAFKRLAERILPQL